MQEQLESLCTRSGIQLLFLTADLEADERWDLARADTLDDLARLCEEGLVDVILGGPPCSTFSKARHNWKQAGPRPVRSRLYLWGLPGLKEHEQRRVDEPTRWR